MRIWKKGYLKINTNFGLFGPPGFPRKDQNPVIYWIVLLKCRVVDWARLKEFKLVVLEICEQENQDLLLLIFLAMFHPYEFGRKKTYDFWNAVHQ